MPILSIRHGLCGGRATVIGTEEWPVGGPEADRWVAILAGVVVYAFLERPATIISPPVPSASFLTTRRGGMRRVHRRPRSPLPFGSYWIGVVDSCPETLLWEISDEGEFELGELWITAIPGDDLARADRLVEAGVCADMAVRRTDEEVLTMDAPADGRALVWLNASRPLAEIVDAVREIAERRGWTLGSVEHVGSEARDCGSGD